MREMIDLKRRLESVARQGARLHKHARVVDENIEARKLCLNLAGELAHRVERGEIGDYKFDVRIFAGALNFRDHILRARFVAPVYENCVSQAREVQSSLFADAVRRAGDENGCRFQVQIPWMYVSARNDSIFTQSCVRRMIWKRGLDLIWTQFGLASAKLNRGYANLSARRARTSKLSIGVKFRRQ